MEAASEKFHSFFVSTKIASTLQLSDVIVVAFCSPLLWSNLSSTKSSVLWDQFNSNKNLQ